MDTVDIVKQMKLIDEESKKCNLDHIGIKDIYLNALTDEETLCGFGVTCTDVIECHECVLHEDVYEKNKPKLLEAFRDPDLIVSVLLE